MASTDSKLQTSLHERPVYSDIVTPYKVDLIEEIKWRFRSHCRHINIYELVGGSLKRLRGDIGGAAGVHGTSNIGSLL